MRRLSTKTSLLGWCAFLPLHHGCNESSSALVQKTKQKFWPTLWIMQFRFETAMVAVDVISSEEANSKFWAVDKEVLLYELIWYDASERVRGFFLGIVERGDTDSNSDVSLLEMGLRETNLSCWMVVRPLLRQELSPWRTIEGAKRPDRWASCEFRALAGWTWPAQVFAKKVLLLNNGNIHFWNDSETSSSESLETMHCGGGLRHCLN